MNTEDYHERIEDYLLGRLADPVTFERELNQNPELRQEMEATRLALDAITAGEDHALKVRLRKLDGDFQASSTVAETQTTAKIVPIDRRRRRSWVRYAAAAAVVCFLAGYFLLRPAPDQRLEYALSQVQPYDNIAYTITKGATGDDPRAAAYTAYEAGNYPRAEAAFNQLDTDDAADDFYRAQSQLAQGKYDAALPTFDRLAARTNFQLAPEADFYAAVARLGLGQTTEATATLEQIAADVQHPLQSEARDLLERL
ncbi:tetratricopeptide repeat protein [Neolewinella sp.]|uniref:tetratricopeptide repeat protein n=1 Tax=Neolewinella sp. TaxID=2993543 RepID=UPI003B52DB1F